MTADSQWPVHQAVYQALVDSAGVGALIGDRIYDEVPQGAATFPYVVIGEATALPFDGQTLDGMEQTLTLHIWSRYPGQKEAKQIMAAVAAALDDRALSVSGHTLVNLRFEFSEVFTDEDRKTRHGVQRYRIVTHT